MDRRNEKDFMGSREARFGIYQIKPGTAGVEYCFMGMDFVKRKNFEICKEHYGLVYQDALKAFDSVETIFERFNLERPEDFRGHSLSVSDVVVFKEGDRCCAYYIDTVGAVYLPDFYKTGKEKARDAADCPKDVLDLYTRVPGSRWKMDEEKVRLDIHSYSSNGNIAIELISVSPDGEEEPFCNLTTNLGVQLPLYCAYVDTNHLPEAEKFIQDNNLGKYSGFSGSSGYCTYPMYLFNEERLAELCPSGLAQYKADMGITEERKIRKGR